MGRDFTFFPNFSEKNELKSKSEFIAIFVFIVEKIGSDRSKISRSTQTTDPDKYVLFPLTRDCSFTLPICGSEHP
jgi:hypothetical protein